MTIDLNIIREKFRRDEEISLLQRQRYKDERNQRISEWDKNMSEIIKPASKDDYVAWLKGYLEKGGEITHVYNYPFICNEWFIVTTDFKIVPLYGADSLNIIVPKGIKYLGGERGHINIYYMDNYSTSGGFVPLFSDIKEI